MPWRFARHSLTSPSGHSWSAVSGGGSYRGLPNGTYDIGTAVILPANNANRPYTDPNRFAWWCPLTPRFATGRTGLGIHPDGNVPGTMGCIGIRGRDTRDCFNALSSTGDRELIVG